MPILSRINFACQHLLYVSVLRSAIRRIILVVLAWIFLGLMLLNAAFGQNAVTGMRIGMVTVDQVSGLRLVVETAFPLQAKLSLLSDPYRLVIDMPDTSWQAVSLPRSGDLSVGPANAYRFGVPRPNTGRLVIELAKPVAPVRAFVLPPASGGQRFVLDLVDVGGTAFMVAAAALRNNPAFSFSQVPVDSKNAISSTTAITRQMKLPKSKAALLTKRSNHLGRVATSSTRAQLRRNQRWVVFIDAGHGGKDPGAIGKAGTQEKKITLAAARDLAKQLLATGEVQPILARSDDRFLRLRERIRLARRQQADVFISLHADSALSSEARGISVFTLSDNASDKEAAALARKENRADLIGGPDLGVEDADAAGELLRMFQRESMNQSSQLAAAILSQIRDMPGGDRRGHRFAGFAVLKAPDMPSVLVEMGFLSNRADEKNLRNSVYISKLNRKLVRAVINYLNAYGPKR